MRSGRLRQIVGAWTVGVVLIGDPAFACEARMRVTGVKPNDVLMIREGPSLKERVIGIIAPEARGIETACECVREWCKVQYFDVVGWVSRIHLAPDRQ